MSAALTRALKSGLRGACAAIGFAMGKSPPAHLPRVLCYHGVCEKPEDEWSVTPAQLRRHMRLLLRHGSPVSLGQILAWLRGEVVLPPRALAVTFDDGYLDVLTHAAPILAEAGVPGAVFVVSDLPDGGTAHPSFAPRRPLLGWTQLRELQGLGWAIGSHTKTHPVLAHLSAEEARAELSGSRAAIEDRLGTAVTLLAYPYGTRRTVSGRDVRLAAQAGYEAAFLDMTGAIGPEADPMALARSKVLHDDAPWMVLSSMRGHMDLWRHVEAR